MRVPVSEIGWEARQTVGAGWLVARLATSTGPARAPRDPLAVPLVELNHSSQPKLPVMLLPFWNSRCRLPNGYNNP